MKIFAPGKNLAPCGPLIYLSGVHASFVDITTEIPLLYCVWVHVDDVVFVPISVDFDFPVSLAEGFVLSAVKVQLVDTSVLPRDDDCCSCRRSVNFWIFKTEPPRVSRSGPVFHCPGAVFSLSIRAAEEIIAKLLKYFPFPTFFSSEVCCIFYRASQRFCAFSEKIRCFYQK